MAVEIGSCVVKAHQETDTVEVIQADDLVDISQELLDAADGKHLKVDGDQVDIGDGQAVYKILGPSPDQPRCVRASRTSPALGV